MANFKTALTHTLHHEGGYAMVAGDKGGETYVGISRRYHPDWQGWHIVDRWKPLKRNQVIKDTKLDALVASFYKNSFWDKVRGDEIEDQRTAGFIFDWAVNSGRGIKEVQRVLGVAMDGKVGPKTIAAINEKGPCLFDILKEARRAYFHGLVAADSTQKKFLTGWLRRVDSFT